MGPEIAVLDIQGQYRIYTECYRSPAAEKTIILINGSLATTASFTQTVRNLYPDFNVVLYDQPYAGKSKPHNEHPRAISKDEEGQILLELIDHFQAEYLLSFSWGGACALIALAERPRRVEKAIISSFSPVLNEPMLDYLLRGTRHLGSYERHEVGRLINSTLGKHLPSLFKRFNQRHVSSLDRHEYAQMNHHIHDVLRYNLATTLAQARAIDVPVLFVNGEWDEYTTHHDAKGFAQHVKKSHFSCIHNTGHFLDMEHKAARRDTRLAMVDFLQPGVRETAVHYRLQGDRYAVGQSQRGCL